MNYEIKIAADTLPELVDAINKIAAAYSPAPAGDAAPAEDAPKGRRRTAAKTTGETETGAASEPAPSDKPALVAADEPTVDVEAEPADVKPAAQAEATQEDKDALLKEATMFSQEHGHEALLGALKAVGAERFSAIPFEKYGDFRAAMSAHGIGASALS